MDKLKTLSILALIGLGALIFFLRLHTYDEPLERDITTYAVIAHEMLGGKTLYAELWDHKPPAIHVTYAAAELIAGYGRDSIFIVNVLAAVATMLACYFAGSAAGGDRLGGFIAATFWALASGDLALEANQPNTEVFLNCFLTAGFAIFMRAQDRHLGIGSALIAGLLFGIGSLYKQVVVIPAAFVALAYCVSAQKNTRGKAIVDVAIVGAVGAGIWAIVFGYFAARGHIGAFSEAVFTYNSWYSGNVWRNLTHFSGSPNGSTDVLAVIVSTATLPIAGLIFGFIFGPRRPWILLLAFALGTEFAILLPGRFFPHYYQLWLPLLAIAAGWTTALFKRVLPVRLKGLSYAAGGMVCVILIFLEIPNYQLPAASWSARKYGSVFVETDQLANKIDSVLPRGATFYEWGNETGLYFTSGRRPPSGIVFAYPMLGGPVAKKLSERVVNDLDRAKPELIVADLDTAKWTQPDHPVRRWLNENYVRFGRTNRFLLLSRKGSTLAASPKVPAN